VVITPSRREAGDPAWLGAAAKRAGATLTPQGVVYVLAPPGARRRLRKALREHGLESVEAFLHAPDVRRSRFLVPLRRETLRHALTQLVPLSSRNRPLAALVAALPSTRALARLAGPVGFAAQRSSAPELFGWLGEGGAPPTAIVALGTEPERMTLHVFPRPARSPSFVAKLGGGPARDSALAAAEVHAATAGSAGIVVPGPLPPIASHEPVWRETAVSGTNAAVFLRRRPGRLSKVVQPLVTWLDEWQRRTACESAFHPELLDEWVREPLAALRSSLGAGLAYEDRLEALCRRPTGRVPLVTMHGDLTMANVIVQSHRANGRTALGVVDWETSRTGALPLLDLFDMVADAAAAVGGYEDRPAAAQQCFSTGGASAASTSSARRRLAGSLGLNDDVTALCFHACWLHHAVNEARARQPGEPRPFLEILDWIAKSRELLPGLAIP
jgi:Phosphotransferase enzyme family